MPVHIKRGQGNKERRANVLGILSLPGTMSKGNASFRKGNNEIGSQGHTTPEVADRMNEGCGGARARTGAYEESKKLIAGCLGGEGERPIKLRDLVRTRQRGKGVATTVLRRASQERSHRISNGEWEKRKGEALRRGIPDALHEL